MTISNTTSKERKVNLPGGTPFACPMINCVQSILYAMANLDLRMTTHIEGKISALLELVREVSHNNRRAKTLLWEHPDEVRDNVDAYKTYTDKGFKTSAPYVSSDEQFKLEVKLGTILELDRNRSITKKQAEARLVRAVDTVLRTATNRYYKELEKEKAKHENNS
jgi:hypothetical protein